MAADRAVIEYPSMPTTATLVSWPLVAMIEGSGAENNGYSLLDVFAGGTLRLKGFKKQAKYEWPT